MKSYRHIFLMVTKFNSTIFQKNFTSLHLKMFTLSSVASLEISIESIHSGSFSGSFFISSLFVCSIFSLFFKSFGFGSFFFSLNVFNNLYESSNNRYIKTIIFSNLENIRIKFGKKLFHSTYKGCMIRKWVTIFKSFQNDFFIDQFCKEFSTEYFDR
jgi:hypothetical protein